MTKVELIHPVIIKTLTQPKIVPVETRDIKVISTALIFYGWTGFMNQNLNLIDRQALKSNRMPKASSAVFTFPDFPSVSRTVRVAIFYYCTKNGKLQSKINLVF